MPPFPKPKVDFTYDVDVERRRLRDHRDRRGLPTRSRDSLLIGSWNIANLGVQERRDCDLLLIATILKWFDLVAIQEAHENTADLFWILRTMGPHYRALMTDHGGNGERLVYIYDDRVLEQAEEVGEMTVPPSMQRHIKLPGVERVFTGFDRPPYLATFTLRRVPWSIQMANVHLYYGSDAEEDRERRALETAAIARWARLRAESEYLGARQAMVIGDFNMPKARRDGGNVVYDALTSKGLVLPAHSTQIGSSIASDNQYDQVAVLPGSPGLEQLRTGVFDFDGVVFKELWERGDPKPFNEYVRYYLSDHRILWVMRTS